MPIQPFSLNLEPAGTDVKTGYVFCIECEDFVYDSTFERLQKLTKLAEEEKATVFEGTLFHATISGWHNLPIGSF